MQTPEFRVHRSDKSYERVQIPQDKISWDVDYPEYSPVDFYHTKHLPNSRHWSVNPKIKPSGINADLENGDMKPVSIQKFRDIVDVEGKWLDPNNKNHDGEYGEYRKMRDRLYALAEKYNFDFDERGRPLNPSGRTGLEGLGLLWDWGPIFVTEGIVTKEVEVDGERKLQIKLIKKWENKKNKIPDKEWKFPGGAVERGATVGEQDENSAMAASRELQEESGLKNIKFTSNDIVFDGYTESGRNTDNSWMVSTAYHKHHKLGEAIEEGEVEDRNEIAETAWVGIDPNDERFQQLSSSHKKMLPKVFEKLNLQI